MRIRIRLFVLAAPLLVFTAGCLPIPRAEVEWPGRIFLPVTFEKAWFRTESRPFLAFSKSGELIVDETDVSFASGDMSLNIPFREVKAVRWGKMKGDMQNIWAIVEYRRAGVTKTAAFMDGRKLGWGGQSDKIYSTLKYAAEVRNDVAPVVIVPPSHVASGWIKFSPGSAIMSLPGGDLPMVVSFKSKAPERIWTRVTSEAPGLVTRTSEVGELGPGDEQVFLCNVLKIVGDRVYPVDVRVYSDAARTRLVERISTGLRMSPTDAAVFEKLHKEVQKQ